MSMGNQVAEGICTDFMHNIEPFVEEGKKWTWTFIHAHFEDVDYLKFKNMHMDFKLSLKFNFKITATL